MPAALAASTPLSRPLSGVQVLEFEGLGPGPLAGRMLADLGAQVRVLVRPGPAVVAEQLGGPGENPLRRGKQVEVLDLKRPEGLARARALVAQVDALIEGNRPGVMERLGLGPADCAALNPRLAYGRMTGWGQQGPLATAAGHDLNYVALTGLLGLGRPAPQAPQVPPTVLGDAAGALGLAFGLVSAVLAARAGGPGRVVDAAIVDVVSMLGGLAHWIHGGGQLGGARADGRPSPFHDSPFYDSYRCACGGWVTVGALEPPFYAQLLQRLGLDDVDPAAQHDTAAWPALKARLAAVFAQRPRTHWQALLEGSDVCFAPVLGLEEAPDHPHHLARGSLRRDAQGRVEAAPAPRFLPLGPG
ncbi:CaiB/BaiF CoA transferase family protein [Ideonella livida]|uniref:CoA transferase n=1 Tax=Ideonella livida TaxID=2707176 RepID=A0A7C9PE81_9BURK|nr:CaiB/BaiF CoA-transferase family protein [Ideonella livida]NDY89576.1 CoA transferase [Ideonella livida]